MYLQRFPKGEKFTASATTALGNFGGEPDRPVMADFGQRLSDQAATATSEYGDGILLPD
jgi:hypothetical protein